MTVFPPRTLLGTLFYALASNIPGGNIDGHIVFVKSSHGEVFSEDFFFRFLISF